MVTAFVMIRVGTGAPRLRKDSERENKKIEGVKTVYIVFGRYDLIAHVEAPTLEELSRVAEK